MGIRLHTKIFRALWVLVPIIGLYTFISYFILSAVAVRRGKPLVEKAPPPPLF